MKGKEAREDLGWDGTVAVPQNINGKRVHKRLAPPFTSTEAAALLLSTAYPALPSMNADLYPHSGRSPLTLQYAAS